MKHFYHIRLIEKTGNSFTREVGLEGFNTILKTKNFHYQNRLYKLNETNVGFSTEYNDNFFHELSLREHV